MLSSVVFHGLETEMSRLKNTAPPVFGLTLYEGVILPTLGYRNQGFLIFFQLMKKWEISRFHENSSKKTH